jgi:hypothetical protein
MTAEERTVLRVLAVTLELVATREDHTRSTPESRRIVGFAQAGRALVDALDGPNPTATVATLLNEKFGRLRDLLRDADPSAACRRIASGQF